MTYLIQYKADYDNAIQDFNLAQLQKETSQIAYDMLLTEYSSDSKGFIDLLEVQMQLFNFQLLEKQSLLASRIALSNIERITNY